MYIRSGKIPRLTNASLSFLSQNLDSVGRHNMLFLYCACGLFLVSEYVFVVCDSFHVCVHLRIFWDTLPPEIFPILCTHMYIFVYLYVAL